MTLIMYNELNFFLMFSVIMNALALQNLRHKCDLGNKNDSVTDKEITADNI